MESEAYETRAYRCARHRRRRRRCRRVACWPIRSARPGAPAPVAPLETVDVLIANTDIGSGNTVSASDLRWQTWPAAAAGANFIRKSDRPDAIKELAGAITRAVVLERRTDPRSQADQGQWRRLHGRHAAVRHARDLDGNLSRNRRRRLHPAERPRRRHPVPPRQGRRRRAPASKCTPAKSSCPNVTRAGDRPDGRREERPARRGRQDRDARTDPAAGRDARAVAPARHHLARAAQPGRFRTTRASQPVPKKAAAAAASTWCASASPPDHNQMKVTTRGRMMGNTSLIHTALLVALIVAFGLAATGRAPAGEPRPTRDPGRSAATPAPSSSRSASANRS